MLLRTLFLVALLQLQLIWVIPLFLEAAAALTARFYNKELRPNIALSARRAGINPTLTIALCYHYSHLLVYSYL